MAATRRYGLTRSRCSSRDTLKRVFMDTQCRAKRRFVFFNPFAAIVHSAKVPSLNSIPRQKCDTLIESFFKSINPF